MSRKKIATTIGLAPEVFERLEKEKAERDRSYGFIVEETLRERYKLPRSGEGAKENANKVTAS